VTILVLAAHPDDEVLGCGGTIARYALDGHDVHIAILGEGITSRFSDQDQVEPTELDTLHDHSRHVSDFLGARSLSLFGLPDNRFDTIPMLDVVKIIERLISELNPEIVYTQHGGDLNVDHAVLYRATLTATRPIAGDVVREVYAYEVASSTEWAFQQFSPKFSPNVFQDITATIDRKIEAMQLYETEVRPFPHPRSPEALRACSRRWGTVIGVEAAEAFQLVRSVRRSIAPG
jgi:LmbE family N-acetylglucosaminyl deacetylase